MIMENKLQIFENDDFGAVRTIVIDDEIYFVANDVCRVLEISNPKDAVRSLEDDEKSGVDITDPHGRVQKTNCITESGLYSLIMRSRKPEAKSFRRWITHDVIPALRKHGAYITPEAIEKIVTNPEYVRALAEQLFLEKDRADRMTELYTEAKPRADYYDAFVSPDDCTNIRNTAKELRVPERFFVNFLISAKYIYRDRCGRLYPYSKSVGDGLFCVRDYVGCNGHKGTYTLITPKGKLVLRSIFENL